MNATHTPGPWVNRPGANDAGAIYGSDGRSVASIHYQEDEHVYEANKRTVAAAPEMREILARIVNTDPIYNDADEGPFCTFCMVQWAYYPSKAPAHKADCEWEQARALLARIDGD